MDETWILLALLAVMLYGVSQVATKVSLGRIPASGFISLSIVVSTPICIVCLSPYIASGELFEVDPLVMIVALAAASFGQLGYYFYLEAAERGSISIVGSVTAAYPIMVIVVAIVFLAEAPTILQLVGVLLVTASMIVLSYMHGKGADSTTYIGKWFGLCIVSVIFYGLWAIFTKLALGDMPSLMFVGIYGFVIPPTVLGYYVYKGVRIKKALPTWSVAFIVGIIASEIGNIGFFCEVYAADQGPASIVFPLVAANPVIVVLLAYGFLKERLTWKEVILVALVIVGIVMASSV
jgi:drug/metabolite transporter (DMT)-like permease